MEDLIVKRFPQPVFEVGECCFTREVGILDACIEPIMPSLIPIANDFHEIVHGGIFFKIPEQLYQKQTDGVIGKAHEGIFMGDDGPYKREIDQGSHETGKSADDPAIGMDPDISLLVGILG